MYKGNKKADNIAKQRAAGHGLNVEHEAGLPYCAGVNSIKKQLQGRKFNNWNYIDSCRWYKDIMEKDLQNWTKNIWN